MPFVYLGLALTSLATIAVGAVAYFRSTSDEAPAPEAVEEPVVPTSPSAPALSKTPPSKRITDRSDDIVRNLVAAYGVPEVVARAVVETSAVLGMNPKHLAAVIHFESATRWTSSVRNASSGATGVIQFMPRSARILGTTTAELARMSVADQIRGPVREYFRRVRDGEWYDGTSWARDAEHAYPAVPLTTFQSVAMSVFFPLLRSADNLNTTFPNRVRDANNGMRDPAEYLRKVRARQPVGVTV